MAEHLHITPIGDDGMYVLDTASWRVFRPVMDKGKGINCGICLSYCPVSSIQADKDKNYYISYDYCKGCGICAAECPKQAIEMAEEGAFK